MNAVDITLVDNNNIILVLYNYYNVIDKFHSSNGSFIERCVIITDSNALQNIQGIEQVNNDLWIQGFNNNWHTVMAKIKIKNKKIISK